MEIYQLAPGPEKGNLSHPVMSELVLALRDLLP
jgi:hypothetical protein